MTHRSLVISCLLFALTGCPSTHTPPADPLVLDEEATATIGASGGTLELGSLELIVPPGALSSDTEIRAVVTRTPIPGLFEGYSPIVRFEPDGLSFDAPVEVRIPFEGDAALASVFWSQRDGDAYVARQTRVVGGYAIATTTHFSSAFVGTACSGDTCCDAANGELDLLLVVDDSGSMGEEQALLRAEIPRIARILASGDRNGDGVQDFPALASVHVGVVSTDLGAGEATGPVPSCDSGYGGDGILVSTTTTAIAGCMAAYPSGIIGYEDGDDIDAFVTQLGCVADLGTSGCGFEQQLEATLIALSPEAPTAYTDTGYVAPEFLGGRPGHGDGANLGFARDESILAVLQVTDETDTSTADIQLFSSDAPEYAGINLNLRGTAAGGDSAEALFPVSRYVDGLLALRTSPADLIFGAVAGVPPEMVTDPAHVDFTALMSHAGMAELPEPGPTPMRLAAVCETAAGMAFPARRIVETAAGIDAAGGGTVIGSICEPSFDAIIDGLIERIAARASGSCG